MMPVFHGSESPVHDVIYAEFDGAKMVRPGRWKLVSEEKKTPWELYDMVKAGDHLFVAGPPDVFDAERPFAAVAGKTGAVLLALSAENGQAMSETELEAPPVFDGMIAANDSLYLSLEDGSIVCLLEH